MSYTIILKNYASLISALAFVFLSPVLGGLCDGIGRIISARMQRRIGPPVFQPFYDFFKLIQKGRSMVDNSQLFYVFWYMFFNIFSGIIFFIGGDLLLFFFSLMLANTFLILAGYAANSPFSHIGTERELILMVLYEPIMILSIVGIYFLTKSFNVKDIIQCNIPIILFLPGCFVGMIVLICIKLQKSPFDISMSHHPHQELVKGLTSDFSGIILAIIEFTHWYKYVFLLAFIYLFFAFNPIIGIIATSLVFNLIIFIDNIFSRFKYKDVIKIVMIIALILGFGNITFLYILKTFTNVFINFF